MALPWFRLLSSLAFLRVNYRHFNGTFLPPWAQGDALPAERLDEMTSLITMMAGQEGNDLNHAVSDALNCTNA